MNDANKPIDRRTFGQLLGAAAMGGTLPELTLGI